MKNTLNHIFYFQIFLFFLIIFSISIVTLFLIEKEKIQDSAVSSFHHDLELASNELNFQLKISEENIKALSSRSMIKNELYKLHKGDVSLNDVKRYTDPKYEDGASVYKNILFAVRFDDKNNIIAGYNEDVIDSNPEYEKRLKINKMESVYIVYLKNDIYKNAVYIGYDYAAFKISNFDPKNYSFLLNMELQKEELENTDIKNYSNSIKIGETNLFLSATLNSNIISEKIRDRIIIVLYHGTLLFLFLIVVSYFTVLKLVRKLIMELNKSHQQVLQQEKDMVLGQITGGLAHNFNNILMSIVGYSDLLSQDNEMSQKVKKALNVIHQSSLRAAAIIKQLLDFNRQSYIELSKTNIVHLIDKIIKDNHYNKNISIDFNDKEYLVNTDLNHLRLIVDNLVKNSIEANSSNIRIGVYNYRAQNIESCQICSMPFIGEWVCLFIEDDGDGIPTDIKLEKLFDPFFTLNEVGYTGLGLSQVYGIVKQHEGHIEVKRNSGRGTTFNIYFPA